MNKKRATLLLFCFLVLFSLGLTAFVYHKNNESRQLQELNRQILCSNLENNSLLTHFLLKDPSKYDIDADKIRMPLYSAKDTSSRLLRKNLLYQKILSVPEDRLSKLELHKRNALLYSLSHELKQAEYTYFQEPFSPYDGVMHELPILLTEYDFAEPKDVDHYLQILELLPAYLESLCQYEKEKASKGMFMADCIADESIAALDSYCQLSEDDNPLLSSFAERIQPLTENGSLSQEKADYYIAQNKRLITTVLLPAYAKTGDALLLLKSGERKPPLGLYHYPDGRQYYEILLSSALGEDINPPALKSVLTTRLVADMQEINCLIAANPEYFVSLFEKQTAVDPLTALSPEQCLDSLKVEMQADFAPVPARQYPYQVKQVSRSMENGTNPAYYFTPPIDDPAHNIIYINGQYTKKGIGLYTTLAHEGFPGHLYQSVSSALSCRQNSSFSLSGVCYFGGYTEGYATYVEFLSYEYAKKAAKKLSSSDTYSLYYDYLALNRKICLNLYSILDIMIHYEGAGKDEIRPYLSKIGVKDEADINTVYNYIVMSPATYITYYGGYIKMLECRNLAYDSMGSDFSEQKFHKLLLELGPMNFEEIKKEIRCP